jgi:hypothetical protein
LSYHYNNTFKCLEFYTLEGYREEDPDQDGAQSLSLAGLDG